MRRNRIKTLCALKELSVTELAKKIDMQPHALRRYTRQEAQPRLELAQAIAEALDVPVDDVLGVQIGAEKVDESKQKLPLYGAVQAGIGEDISDLTDPIDAIDTPSWLASVPDAYAVFVSGTSMAPRFNPREICYVHPGRPYRAGDYVVVQLSANGSTHAIVKQFIELTDTHVVLRQHNPDRELKYGREQVSAIHVVVGTYFA
jgi:phage repressor protein C with HTH and peptisase S24 domain